MQDTTDDPRPTTDQPPDLPREPAGSPGADRLDGSGHASLLDQRATPEADYEAAPGERPASRWRRLFGRGRAPDDTQARIAGLSAAIEADPDSAANYVFRGELRLQARDYAAAAADFRRAIDLAAEQIENNDWGVIAQVLRDRAASGLQKASPFLPEDSSRSAS